MSLVWNGDWVGETLDSRGGVTQYGDLEYKGSFTGSPALNTRLILGTSTDGVTGRAGGQFAKFLMKPGDQYGSSSGERCIIRQTEPIVSVGQGYESYLAFSVMFPPQWGFGLGGNLDIYQMIEWHGPGGIPACVGLRPLFDHVRMEVKGGSLASPVFQPPVTVVPDLQSKLGVWHDFILHVLHHTSNGTARVFHRLASQASFTQVANLTGVPTKYSDGGTYLLLGIYGPGLNVDRWIYHGGAREYTTFAEAEAWMLSLGGGGGGG